MAFPFATLHGASDLSASATVAGSHLVVHFQGERGDGEIDNRPFFFWGPDDFFSRADAFRLRREHMILDRFTEMAGQAGVDLVQPFSGEWLGPAGAAFSLSRFRAAGGGGGVVR